MPRENYRRIVKGYKPIEPSAFFEKVFLVFWSIVCSFKILLIRIRRGRRTVNRRWGCWSVCGNVFIVLSILIVKASLLLSVLAPILAVIVDMMYCNCVLHRHHFNRMVLWIERYLEETMLCSELCYRYGNKSTKIETIFMNHTIKRKVNYIQNN